MNLVKEFLLLKDKVDKLYCQLISKSTEEQDPTVPTHVKNIKQDDIDNWNKVRDVKDVEVQITETNHFAEVGQNQKDFNKNVSDYKVIIDNKNIEQDGRIENLEDENIAQYDLIHAFHTSLNNKLDKGNYTGTAQDLKNEIDTKQKKLSSFDESILIETDGNIEGNVSLFTEYFNQQNCELNFTPTQIIGVYKNGVKLLLEEFNITLPKTITITTYSSEKIEIQYTHLKNN